MSGKHLLVRQGAGAARDGGLPRADAGGHGTGSRSGPDIGTGTGTGTESGSGREAGSSAGTGAASGAGAVPAAARTSTTGGGKPRIRVLLADDEHLIRGALAALLALEEDLTIVAEAASGPEALAMARAHEPDVAVLDLQMPGADGVKVATELRDALPSCRNMIVTSHARPGHLKRALAAGVRGFVPKTASAQQLAEIIRAVNEGIRYVDPELAADAISAGDSPLTAREAELLDLAADGAPVAEIAAQASLTAGTVRNYLSAATAKLGAENRHAAARIARERGWL